MTVRIDEVMELAFEPRRIKQPAPELIQPRLAPEPTQPPKEDNFVPMAVRKSFVWSYRISAVLTLYGILLGFFAYVFLLGFYAVDSSWVAPLVISPADDKALDLTVKMVQTETAAQTLELDVKKLQASLPEYRRHRAQLLLLEPQIKAALQREHQHNITAGAELVGLNQQKNLDNVQTASVMDQVREAENQINRDLSAGLITKGDAAVQRTALNQAQSTFTDSRIAETMMKDAILQKNTTNTNLLDTLTRQAELVSEITRLDVTIDATERQIGTEQEQIASMYSAIQTARSTPYYMAMTQGRNVNFAFVPYGNRGAVHTGSTVYDCYLNMIACRPVGKVIRIFSEEEHAIHPLFRTDMRGYLVQMELTRPQSVESETMMLNHKPFGL
jgi:hypothetical protein